MKEMKDYEAQEQKEEDAKFEIQSEAYFAFSVKPAEIHNPKVQKEKKPGDDIKLFDFDQ